MGRSAKRLTVLLVAGYTGSKPLPKHYFLLTPFGPGREGSTLRSIGDYPNLGVN